MWFWVHDTTLLGATVPQCERLCMADKSFREVHDFHRKWFTFPAGWSQDGHMCPLYWNAFRESARDSREIAAEQSRIAYAVGVADG